MSPPGEFLNPEGTPLERFTPCNADGPYGWVDHLGNLRPIRCNRPRHAEGDHSHSAKGQAGTYRWASNTRKLFTTSKGGAWQVVERVD